VLVRRLECRRFGFGMVLLLLPFFGAEGRPFSILEL